MDLLKDKIEESTKEDRIENPPPPPRAREASVFGDLDCVQHAWQRGILTSDLEAMRKKLNTTAEVINGWLKYMDDVGWVFINGKPINWKNFRRPLRLWEKFERNHPEWRGEKRGRESKEPKRESEAERKARLAKITADPKSWNLCEERCACFIGGRCSRGVTVPPMHNPHPHPPEECPKYAAREEAS